MRDVIHMDEPGGPAAEDGLSGRRLVQGGHQAPDVARHEQRDDGEGDSRQTIFLSTHHAVGRVLLLAVVTMLRCFLWKAMHKASS